MSNDELINKIVSMGIPWVKACEIAKLVISEREAEYNRGYNDGSYSDGNIKHFRD